MKIVIVGIGGVGGIIGGKLARHDSGNVNFFCRGKTLEKIVSRGLELRSNNDVSLVHPFIATDSPHVIGKADAVIYAVKNYNVESAAGETAPMIGKETVIIPLLNGLEAERKLRNIFSESQVLGGCIYVSAFVVSPGVVQQNGNMLKVLFGNSSFPQDENLRRYSEILNIFNAAGINTVLTSQIENEMWIKFIMISSLAAATSVYMRNVGELLKDKESAELFKGLVHEIVAVAKSSGVTLPENIEEETLTKSHSFVPETKTSMQLDFERGNINELEALVGYVCHEAKKLGVKAALYDKVYNELRSGS